MIPLEELRKIDPETSNLTDDELKEIRQYFYDYGQLIFDDWLEIRKNKKLSKINQ